MSRSRAIRRMNPKTPPPAAPSTADRARRIQLNRWVPAWLAEYAAAPAAAPTASPQGMESQVATAPTNPAPVATHLPTLRQWSLPSGSRSLIGSLGWA
jgi:hypothetical protein